VVLEDAISHNDFQKGFIGSLANFAILSIHSPW